MPEHIIPASERGSLSVRSVPGAPDSNLGLAALEAAQATNMTNIYSLGYDAFYQRHFERFCASIARGARDLHPERIVRQDREAFIVSDGAVRRLARLSGQLRRTLEATGDIPTVGDWVLVDDSEASDAALLCSMLPRRSVLLRKAAGRRTIAQPIAANVDRVFIVTGLDDDFSPRRVERYLAAVEASGAAAAVVLSKADLIDDPGELIGRLRVSPLIPVLPVSAVSSSGLSPLRALLPAGSTSVLVGSSGVGKSTLINVLLGEQLQPTRPVRARDQRGQHTTTCRELLHLPGGALLIDTPGLREFVPWIEERELGASFDDVRDHGAECRFRDCRHQGEPGCAVQRAVEQGELDPDRLENYQKQLREVRWLASRRDEHLQREATAKRKELARHCRALKKRGGKWS